MSLAHFLAGILALAGDFGIALFTWHRIIAPAIDARSRKIARYEIDIERRLQPLRGGAR